MFEECKLTFLTDINKLMTENKIPPELVLNADQTPCSYVSVGRMTMAARNSLSVPIKGLTDKRNITLTFVITLSGEFLPMQVIYKGKTTASQPRGFKLPKGFTISQNLKYHSNEHETLTLIDKVIAPYVDRKRKELKLAPTQKALLIWDVFKGQKTAKVFEEIGIAKYYDCVGARQHDPFLSASGPHRQWRGQEIYEGQVYGMVLE